MQRSANDMAHATCANIRKSRDSVLLPSGRLAAAWRSARRAASRAYVGTDGAAAAQACADMRLRECGRAVLIIGRTDAGRFVLHTWRSVGLTPSATIKSERTKA
jgi:hypothetical protein